MRATIRLIGPAVLASVVTLAGCDDWSSSQLFQRELQRSFKVAPGSIVEVDLSGGDVYTGTGEAGTVTVTLEERVYARTEREADQIIANHDIAIAQEGGTVTVRARRKEHVNWHVWRSPSFNTRIALPTDVRLKLRTSGGDIEVRGDRAGAVDAHTSGGSVEADGGTSAMTLGTSGGRIRVGQVLSSLSAKTSGGSVRVAYVGSTARDVELETSGGQIEAGIDPAASLEIVAETSGGSVEVRDLDLTNDTRQMFRVTGRMNAGAGRFRAHTSGGQVEVFRAAAKP